MADPSLVYATDMVISDQHPPPFTKPKPKVPSSRMFSCLYCSRKFCTSQALWVDTRMLTSVKELLLAVLLCSPTTNTDSDRNNMVRFHFLQNIIDNGNTINHTTSTNYCCLQAPPSNNNFNPFCSSSDGFYPPPNLGLCHHVYYSTTGDATLSTPQDLSPIDERQLNLDL